MTTEQTQTETGWLIESENRMYVCINSLSYGSPRFGWTPDHDCALRFARKQDAEAVIGALGQVGLALHERAQGATEHTWEPRA